MTWEEIIKDHKGKDHSPEAYRFKEGMKHTDPKDDVHHFLEEEGDENVAEPSGPRPNRFTGKDRSPGVSVGFLKDIDDPQDKYNALYEVYEELWYHAEELAKQIERSSKSR
jgi:hypothetical protein